MLVAICREIIDQLQNFKEKLVKLNRFCSSSMINITSEDMVIMRCHATGKNRKGIKIILKEKNNVCHLNF